MTVTSLAPGQGAHHHMIDGDHVAKASVADDAGSFEVFEVVAVPGPPAPPHVSPWSGVLYVLEGTVRLLAEGTSHDLAPGASATLPAGASYTFEVTSPEGARFLAVTSGTGAGRFFADFATSVPLDRPVPELIPDILAVTRRHGVQVTAPAAP